MKKYFPILAGCLAVALGVTGYAASLKSTRSITAQKCLLKDRKQQSKSDGRKQTRAMQEVTIGTPYWCDAVSNFSADGKFTYDEGPTRGFGVRIDIQNEEATIYGLVNLYHSEIDAEYPIKGKYNSRRGTITISGIQYDDGKDPDEFLKIADMYSDELGEYSLVLLAGDFNGWGELETLDELVFNVSEDLSTLTATTGYGAYAFGPSGNAMGFYDFYKNSTLTKGSDILSVGTSTAQLTFDGLFACTGSPVSEEFMIFNKGLEPVEYTISSSSEELTFSPESGRIAGCSAATVAVTFTPTHAGNYEETLTVNVAGLDTPLEVKISKEVGDRPDYMKIVEAGSEYMTFDMSPLYPFVESEYDGHLAFMSTNEGKGDNTESYFTCSIEIPKGKTGIFSWKAVQMESAPNCLMVLLDGEWYKYDFYVNSDDPFDMSGNMVLPEGKYEVAFDNYIQLDWSQYDMKCRSYVWGLDLRLVDSKADNAYCAETGHTFQPTYFDRLAVTTREEVGIFNLGSNPLKVLEIVGDGNFSGTVPEVSVPLGGEISVPITWTATALGEDKGTVVIKTTGGDFSIACEATALTLPADYSAIVKEGEFSFNTSIDFPFVMNEAKTYAYNSSSKQDINGTTLSWIEASFVVEEGKVAVLNWDALNDSEKIFEFMGIPSVISGTIITIDGGEERTVGGQNADCAANDCYEAPQLTFTEGRHDVRFTYKKTSNEDSYVFGDDRLKLFELSLKTMNIDDFKGMLSTDAVTFRNTLYCGCIGHMPLTLYNNTNEMPEISSVECDGPFTVKVKKAEKSKLLMNVEFNADKTGDYSSTLTLHTNIGDYSVSCKGSAEESSIGYALFYEGFEYDFLDSWVIEDTNRDYMTWGPVSQKSDLYERYQPLTADGSDALMISAYDPIEYEYADGFDDVAVTPEITIPAEGKTTLRFMERNYCWDSQSLEILVGMDDDFSAYEILEKIDFFDVIDGWTAYEVDLTEFAGKKVHVAFRAGDVGGTLMLIDDVLIANDAVTIVFSTDAERRVTSREYYSTDGKLLNGPTEGICIEMTRYTDGTMETRKLNTRH